VDLAVFFNLGHVKKLFYITLHINYNGFKTLLPELFSILQLSGLAHAETLLRHNFTGYLFTAEFVSSHHIKPL